MGVRRRLAWARVVVAVALSPRSWPEAARTVVVLGGTRRRSGHAPLPDRQWLAFRMETAYGDAEAVPSTEDVLELLAWQVAARRFATSSSGRAR